MITVGSLGILLDNVLIDKPHMAPPRPFARSDLYPAIRSHYPPLLQIVNMLKLGQEAVDRICSVAFNSEEGDIESLVAFIDEIVNGLDKGRGQYTLAEAYSPEPQHYFTLSKLRREFQSHWLSPRVLADQADLGQDGLDLILVSDRDQPTSCLMCVIDEMYLRLMNVPEEPACARTYDLNVPVANELQLKPATVLHIMQSSEKKNVNVLHNLHLWRQAIWFRLILEKSTSYFFLFLSMFTVHACMYFSTPMTDEPNSSWFCVTLRHDQHGPLTRYSTSSCASVQ